MEGGHCRLLLAQGSASCFPGWLMLPPALVGRRRGASSPLCGEGVLPREGAVDMVQVPHSASQEGVLSLVLSRGIEVVLCEATLFSGLFRSARSPPSHHCAQAGACSLPEVACPQGPPCTNLLPSSRQTFWPMQGRGGAGRDLDVTELPSDSFSL